MNDPTVRLSYNPAVHTDSAKQDKSPISGSEWQLPLDRQRRKGEAMRERITSLFPFLSN